MDENSLGKERSPQGCKITVSKADSFLYYTHSSMRASTGVFTVRMGRRKLNEKHVEGLII